MKRTLTSATVAAVLGLGVIGCNGGSGDPSKDVQSVAKSYVEALQRGDLVALKSASARALTEGDAAKLFVNGLLNDVFVIVHAQKLNIRELEFKADDTRIVGDFARAMATVPLEKVRADDPTEVLSIEISLVREDGQWRVVGAEPAGIRRLAEPNPS